MRHRRDRAGAGAARVLRAVPRAPLPAPAWLVHAAAATAGATPRPVAHRERGPSRASRRDRDIPMPRPRGTTPRAADRPRRPLRAAAGPSVRQLDGVPRRPPSSTSSGSSSRRAEALKPTTPGCRGSRGQPARSSSGRAFPRAHRQRPRGPSDVGSAGIICCARHSAWRSRWRRCSRRPHRVRLRWPPPPTCSPPRAARTVACSHRRSGPPARHTVEATDGANIEGET